MLIPIIPSPGGSAGPQPCPMMGIWETAPEGSRGGVSWEVSYPPEGGVWWWAPQHGVHSALPSWDHAQGWDIGEVMEFMKGFMVAIIRFIMTQQLIYKRTYRVHLPRPLEGGTVGVCGCLPPRQTPWAPLSHGHFPLTGLHYRSAGGATHRVCVFEGAGGGLLRVSGGGGGGTYEGSVLRKNKKIWLKDWYNSFAVKYVCSGYIVRSNWYLVVKMIE